MGAAQGALRRRGQGPLPEAPGRRDRAARGAGRAPTGLKDAGCKFALAFFRPSSALNEELQKFYQANLFSVVRQLRYSQKDGKKSLDLAIFLNGIPIFTAELKNPLTGQTVEDANAAVPV
ncbi:MAG: type I restriction endonuclease [Anaerolineae bacterium]